MKSEADFALSSANFMANKFVNSIANEKDAENSLTKMHAEFNQVAERSTEHIIKILSTNYNKIINSSRNALQIEQDIKVLKNILMEQSKLILEMSTIKEPKLIREFSTDAALKNNDTQYDNNVINIDDSVEAENLLRAVQNCIVEHKFSQIPSLIDNFNRAVVNLETSTRSILTDQMSNIIHKLCQGFSHQILHTCSIILDDHSYKDILIQHLISLKQDQLALNTYLKLITKRINEEIMCQLQFYQNDIKISTETFFKIIIDKFIQTLEFIKSKFTYSNCQHIFYFWLTDNLKTIFNRFLAHLSTVETHFVNLCQIVNVIDNTFAVHRDTFQINFQLLIIEYFQQYLTTIFQLHIRTVKAQCNSLLDFFTYDRDIQVTTKQQEIFNKYDSIELSNDKTVHPSNLHVFTSISSITSVYKPYLKSKIVVPLLNSLLMSYINHILKISPNVKNVKIGSFKQNVRIFVDRILPYFNNNFKKYQITDQQLEAIQRLSMT